MPEILKKVVLVFVNKITNIAFYDICLINLKTEMKYSLQFQHCEISKRQIGFDFAKFGINCLNIKRDVPVNKSTQITKYLKKC